MKRSALLLLLLLASCDQPSQDVAHDPATAIIDQKIAALDARIALIESDLSQIKARDSAFLRPSDKGFAPVETDIGTVTFAISSVSPYADGTRISLRVGNPTSAYITKLTAHVEYGSPNGSGGVVKAGERDIELTNLYRGKWTFTPVDIAAVPPSKFSYLKISSVSVDSISLLPF